MKTYSKRLFKILFISFKTVVIAPTIGVAWFGFIFLVRDVYEIEKKKRDALLQREWTCGVIRGSIKIHFPGTIPYTSGFRPLIRARCIICARLCPVFSVRATDRCFLFFHSYCKALPKRPAPPR